MYRSIILYLCFFLVGFHYLTYGQKINISKLEEFTLKNGLKVYVNEDPTMSTAFGIVAVRAGGKYDPKDATGMGHYLEHMLFKGTDKMGTINYEKEGPLMKDIISLYDELGQTSDKNKRDSIQKRINDVSIEAAEYAIPNEIDRLVNGMGGKNMNAFTSFEVIAYFNSFPPHQINKWLDLYANRFKNPVFRLFQSELETVYEEKNRGMDNYGTSIFETFLENFYKNHPYGQQTVIGSTDHLKNPSLSKMHEYYDTYYVANNMALILSGPFKTKDIKPQIEKLFGDWKRGQIPQYPKYNEAPFTGREFIKKKLSPIKIGLMGFRTVPVNHPDELALEVCNALLSNSGETGFFDKLRLDNKLLGAQMIPLHLNDHGGDGIFFIPKIIGQSLKSAESLILAQLDSLKDGNFTDKQLSSIKNNLIKNHFKDLEDGQSRAYQLINLFIENRKWDELLDYPNKIKKLTRDQVIAVANKYYTDNYLVLYSKMGFPKKDKLEKPKFKPVIPKEGLKSDYEKHFEKIPDGNPNTNFIDFKKDVTKVTVAANNDLFYVKNPLNDIFHLELKFGMGEREMPTLRLISDYLQNVGTETYPEVKKFKEQMFELGCSYQIYHNQDYFILEIEGLDENLAQSIDLVDQLLSNPQKDTKAFKIAINGIKSEAKLEKGDPSTMGRILFQYLTHGNHSSYLNRATIKELEKLPLDMIMENLQTICNSKLTIHYSGQNELNTVKSLLTKMKIMTDRKPSQSPKQAPLIDYQKPKIYIHHRKDARQSQIYFYCHGSKIPLDSIAYMDAFNEYFGGDMSSLVFQEVREFRSLAYSSSATYRLGKKPSDDTYFYGYIGCQTDKTIESLQVMSDLIHQMPIKKNREQQIKRGLIQSSYTNRPNFRDISRTVEKWERWGYTSDPNELKLKQYQSITFDDIEKFYQNHLKNKVVSISILANKKNLDLDAISKFGEIQFVKENDFYKN